MDDVNSQDSATVDNVVDIEKWKHVSMPKRVSLTEASAQFMASMNAFVEAQNVYNAALHDLFDKIRSLLCALYP